MDRFVKRSCRAIIALTHICLVPSAFSQSQFSYPDPLERRQPVDVPMVSFARPIDGIFGTVQTPKDVQEPDKNPLKADSSPKEEKSADTTDSEEAMDAKSDSDYTTDEEYKATEKDSVARKQEYGQQTTNNTRQFLRTQTPLLKTGQWQFDTGISYSINETKSPSIVGPFLTEQQFQFRTVNAIVGFRFGVTERLQWFGSTTVGWQSTQVADGFALVNSDSGGIGDLVTGFNYLLCEESECTPAVITSVDMIAPTGNPRNPRLPFETGTGLGAWAFSSDVLMVKSYDPLVTFWGLGYRHFLEGTYSSQKVKIGDSIQYNFGVGFGVNQNVTLSSSLIGSYLLDTEVNSQRVLGSAGDLISLRLAATLIKNKKIVEPFVTFGLTDRANDASLGVVWTR